MNNFSECKEIVPGLILGSVSDVEQMVEMGADVLVPLAYLDSDVWNTDFRGEILYCPIKDRGVLPLDVLDTMVLKILIRLDKKRKVALFCAGGHGRTGYLAACVLAALGNKDPIGHLRKEYSPHAVETDAQAEGILTYMEKLKAEMDEIYVPWIDNVSKETNERVRKLFAKFYQTGAKKEIEAQRGDTIPLPFEVLPGRELGGFDGGCSASRIFAGYRVQPRSIIQSCRDYRLHSEWRIRCRRGNN